LEDAAAALAVLLVLLKVELLLLLHHALVEDSDELVPRIGDAEEREEEHKQFLARVGRGL
jgi:hypothetical protein